MELLKARFANAFSQDQRIISVLAVENPTNISPLAVGYDLLFFIVTKDQVNEKGISHYIKEGYQIQERRVHPDDLTRLMLIGGNRSIIQWLLQGEILLDRNSYLEQLRDQLYEYPQLMREQRLLVEFSLFLRTFLQSRQYIHDGHVLDAYSQILQGLHHWARITIIEAGLHPEMTVWKQVRKINLGVYKLYEELTLSMETLEQRVQLVLLACEFSVMSKMESCCGILLRILQSREEPWSPMELRNHPELKELNTDLAFILKKLLKKNIIREIIVAVEHDLEMLELRYTL